VGKLQSALVTACASSVYNESAMLTAGFLLTKSVGRTLAGKTIIGINRQIGSGFLVGVYAVAAVAVHAAALNGPAEIQAAYDHGDYRSVIETFEKVSPGEFPSIHSAEQIRWLMMHADAYRKLGMNDQATALLFGVRLAIEGHEQQSEAHALYYGRIGEAYQFKGNPQFALSYFERGLAIANSRNATTVRASLQNDLGNFYLSLGEIPQAIDAYRDSLATSTKENENSLAATSATNLSRALLMNGDARDVRATLNVARQATALMPQSADRLQHLLSLGRLYQTAQATLGRSGDLRLAANDQYRQAIQLAEQLNDERSLSYALGYLGGLYEDELRIDDALLLTERAIEYAFLAGAEEALYQWEWQTARLYVQDSDIEMALNAYRRALRSVRDIRSSLMASSNNIYQDYVGPLYFEMADLLLQRTSSLNDEQEVQANLQEVRQTLEDLKTAEIVEYFDNDCVIQDQDRAALEQLSASAAIIYPIIMEDRLELLVSFPGDIRQVTVPVGRAELTQEIRRFRLGIENAGSGDRFMVPSQRLYDWLVRPIEYYLDDERIDTLVFVPDGPLRTIPMSALHDGQQFLVENYALATTPGISLTSAEPIERGRVQVLANGITESVQGFAALPNVAEELRSIEDLYPTRLNQDAKFQLTSVERSMSEGEYSIVHIATHGQFDSDHRNSFLLAYDDKMTMNRLEEALTLRRYQENAIELLVLSACQTAAGDDRAALGMAGIAIKAGARSALATLWFINDASTSTLMQDFYKNLQTDELTKAEALQRAQVKMLADPGQSHPAHWAPFLLIGNWL
jgi:CHAT domain-containing protein